MEVLEVVKLNRKDVYDFIFPVMTFFLAFSNFPVFVVVVVVVSVCAGQ